VAHLTRDVVTGEDSAGPILLEIGLLGPLTISRDGAPLTLTGPKRRALLILLALHLGTPVPRERIVAALWPEPTSGKEDATLRVHISHLRDVLEADRREPDRPGPHVLLTRGSAYLLNRETVTRDLDHFAELSTRGRDLLADDPGGAHAACTAALALWRGRALEDVRYEDLAQDTIRRLDRQRLEVVQDRAEALLDLGDHRAAIDDLEAVVDADPTCERPVRLLMRAHYGVGHQAEALRVARRHRRDLVRQGLDPTPALTELERRILQHDPALTRPAAPGPVPLEPGRSVRGYELRAPVGRGPVGVVYRAYQAAVGREVVVTRLDRHLVASSSAADVVEAARRHAGLTHPHLVPVLDVWRDASGVYLVAPWYEGGDLRHRLDHPPGWQSIATWFLQVADALGYVHASGSVHGDLTPTNVRFDAAGNAYLGGLALSPNSGSSQADVIAFGRLLDTALRRAGDGAPDRRRAALQEVVAIATNDEPTRRYPDGAALHAALLEAVGRPSPAPPRQVRRNPYRGLAAFAEPDRADFHGREDVVEALVTRVARDGLVAVVGPSGSGKSSVVLAGLLPALRTGVLPGSDTWTVVVQVPGTDPYEEFHRSLRATAPRDPVVPAAQTTNELLAALQAAHAEPDARSLLVVDQFEELFTSAVDPDLRTHYLDDLVGLATDPERRCRVVVTVRADLLDRPLAHARLGPLLASHSVLLAPMRPDQLELAIRRPAARVGVQVQAELVPELVRDVSSSPTSLPLLQYLLTELFERRREDRLTVAAYRALGGVEGVLERQAEATYAVLVPDAQEACRQLFLRLVHLGEHGEETRRRLPLTELHGLGHRGAVDAALLAFTAARLLTHDRDPVTRSPTVEVAHETVILRWSRYRAWIDEARADLHAHRRLASAAMVWQESGEDPAYLLPGGPLAAALATASADRIALNALESRYLAASRDAEAAQRTREAERRQETEALRRRASRRLRVGLASAAVTVAVGVLAVAAVGARQQADEARARAEVLAAAEERQSEARGLAAAAVAQLAGADPELGLLLALEGAERSIAAGESVLPEVVDALHRALVTPRPDRVLVEGAGVGSGDQLVAFAAGGRQLVHLTEDGGAAVVLAVTGEEVARVPGREPPAHGVVPHWDGQRVLTVHHDGVRQWRWGDDEPEFTFDHPATVTAAAYSPDGSRVAVAGSDGVVRLWARGEAEADLAGEHTRGVTTLAFDPSGTRLATAGMDRRLLVWDVERGQVVVRPRTDTVALPILHVAWHPTEPWLAVTTLQREVFLIDAATGAWLRTYGNGQSASPTLAFDPTGWFLLAGGEDGLARLYATAVGGEPVVVLSSAGVPIVDVAFHPRKLVLVTLGADSRIRQWSDLTGSELPARVTPALYPHVRATPAGDRYVFSAGGEGHLAPEGAGARVQVVDAAAGSVLLERPATTDWRPRQPAISADGDLVAFVGPGGDDRGDVELVRVGTGATVARIADAGDQALALALSANGALLAGAGEDGTISLWEVPSGRLVRQLAGHAPRDRTAHLEVEPPVSVHQLEFLPDGQTMVSAGADGTVRVWDVATGAARVVHRFDDEAVAAAPAPDGTRLAVADRSGTVLLLDPADGEVLATLERVSGRTSLVFGPHGQLLAGAGPGPLAHLWDLGTGRIVRRLQGAVYEPRNVAFVNGGSELRVAGGDGIDRGYVLEPHRLVDLARERTSRSLTPAECEQYLRRGCPASPEDR
jgi:WD40 repeat protein/DNA-binding SARP family transcriptional activator